ncbi:MAG: hypothetical protein PVJ42_07370 [bacterium]|jgi:hypothetical protein
MRILSLTIAVGLVLISAAGAIAHAPREVELEFDLGEKELQVTIDHQVTDVVKHFINSVTVELNGEKIIEQKITEQENLKSQVLEYRITEARVGDTITVVAACSISGKKKASLKIAPPPEKDAEEGDEEEDD